MLRLLSLLQRRGWTLLRVLSVLRGVPESLSHRRRTEPRGRPSDRARRPLLRRAATGPAATAPAALLPTASTGIFVRAVSPAPRAAELLDRQPMEAS
jgi:hypothetical protein